MGILDDAIREHLDLKRKHGARDAELREIEDEAFGSAERPDAFTAAGELFSEVTASGAVEAGSAVAEPPETDVGGEEPTRLVEPEALRPMEAAPESEVAEPLEPAEGLDIPEEPLSPPEGLELPAQEETAPGQEELPEPIPGQEELLDDAEPPAPSESLEDLIAEEEPFPEDTAAPPPAPDTAEQPGPESEVEPPPEPAPGPPEPEPEEIAPAEPESSVPDPPPPPPESSEPPGRARGRVDVPTQEHPPPGDTGDLPPFPESEERPQPLSAPDDEEGGGPALYDFETDEDPLEPGPSSSTDDDFEALGPAEEEAPYLEEEEPYAEEALPPLDEPGTAVRPAVDDDELDEEPPPRGKVYEEDDSEEDLWFEKGPPKDFDFD
jgi:hypothetical protein